MEEEAAVRPTELQLEELKQQLRVFQVMHHASLDDIAADPSFGNVEVTLLSKVRKLEHEATVRHPRSTRDFVCKLKYGLYAIV